MIAKRSRRCAALAVLFLLVCGCGEETASTELRPEDSLRQACLDVMREFLGLHDLMQQMQMDPVLPGSSMTEAEGDAIVAAWRAFAAHLGPIQDATLDLATGKSPPVEETREVLAEARDCLAKVWALLEPLRPEILRLYGLERTRRIFAEGGEEGAPMEREGEK